MKLRIWATLVILAFAAAPNAVAAPAGNDFKARALKVWAAWNTLDPANAAPFYAQDPDRVFFDVAPLKYAGWAEYSEGVKKLLTGYSSFKLVMGDDFRAHVNGKEAWTTATFRIDAVTKNGASQVLDGRWTAVWEKRGNDWLIVHEHTSVPIPPVPDTTAQTLYRRLGGYDALAAVTDDFIGRLAHDPQLGKFFVGHSADSLKHIRQLVVDQLCEATGGPCYYIGRDMKTSHAGMGITDKDWQVAANHLVETLDKFHVPQKEKDEVLSAISAMKKDIAAPGAGGGR